MAIRNIVTIGDEILGKKCKKVEKFDAKLGQLLDDMKETLKQANGVGLAAPQVGILRRVVVVDTGEDMLELVNPEIIETEGEESDIEGCLSVPERYGYVTRPTRAVVRAQDRNGEEFTAEGEGLIARCFCHELDHLEGHLFVEKVTEYVDVKALEQEEEA